MKNVRWKALAGWSLLLLQTGCFRTTRSVMKTHPPAQVLSSSLESLVKVTTERYNTIHTLNARVDVSAATGGGKEGQVVEYTSFSAYILIRKPADLHFIGFLPVVGSKMIDMVSDGKTFTIVVPPKNRAITGTNVVSTPSSNPLENLRPSIFMDSFLIQSALPEELVSLTSDDRIYQPDPTRKYVIDEPEYDVGVYKSVANSTELKTQRVIHIGRSTLLPYQQDIYDDKGQLVTVAAYDNYKLFGQTTFPSRITIQRPLDQLRLTLNISQLAINQTLEDDQFVVPKVPATFQVQHLP